MKRLFAIIFLSFIDAYGQQSAMTEFGLGINDPIPLPAVAFREQECYREAQTLLPVDGQAQINRFYEMSTEENQMFLSETDGCVFFIAQSKTDAFRLIAEIVNALPNVKYESFMQSYYREIYPYPELLIENNTNLLAVSIIKAEKHEKGETINPTDFGYLIFEYLPMEEKLYMYYYGYIYLPGE